MAGPVRPRRAQERQKRRITPQEQTNIVPAILGKKVSLPAAQGRFPKARAYQSGRRLLRAMPEAPLSPSGPSEGFAVILTAGNYTIIAQCDVGLAKAFMTN